MKAIFKIELAYQQSKELTINQLIDAIDSTSISKLTPEIMEIRERLHHKKAKLHPNGGLYKIINSQLIIKMIEGEGEQ